MQGVETKWGRLGGVAKSIETVLLKLEVFLPIYGELEVIFAGLMVPLHLLLPIICNSFLSIKQNNLKL